APALAGGLNGGSVEARIGCCHGEAGLALAGEKPRQQAALLLVGSEDDDRLQAENVDVDRGCAAHGGAGFGNGLHHDGGLGDAEAGSAVRFRHGNAEPTGRGERRMQLVRKLTAAILVQPIAIVELEAELAGLIPDLLLLGAQCEIHRPISYCRSLAPCAERGDTTASIAAAMASKRRSAPCSPISMRPTGASPAR